VDGAWEVTHLGGNRFSPTLLVLPFGYAYGRAVGERADESEYRLGVFDPVCLVGDDEVGDGEVPVDLGVLLPRVDLDRPEVIGAKAPMRHRRRARHAAVQRVAERGGR
jgi:hypothetical protein